MVSTTASSSPKKSGIPDGEYRLVGWDLDTTGRSLVDELCHVAGYTPDDTFSQYVMPYRDLNINSRRRHLIRIVIVGHYRMLKNMKNGKVIKSKSEIYALLDFVNWLEKVHNQEPKCNGIILLCHETYELAPLILIEALKRYNLLERFSSLVKGFANCYAFVKQKCEQSMQSFSLRVLSKILLDKENESTNSAVDRARVAYQLVHHLCQGMAENTGAGDSSVSPNVIAEALSPFTLTIADEEKAIESIKLVLARQNTLKPVFGPLMRNSHERRRATTLRRILAEAMFDYDQLKKVWDDGSKGKEALSSLLNDKLNKITDTERQDILNILVNHFDPSKPIPSSEINSRKKRNSTSKKSISEQQSSTPETTPTTVSSPSKSNGSATPIDDSPKHVVNGNNKQKSPAVAGSTNAAPNAK